MNIILFGIRGTGKTAIAKALSIKLNRPFIDLDEHIQQAAGKSISDIVAQHGWNYFRDLEHISVKVISEYKNHIIATGGGTLIYYRNYDLLKPNSILILLTCSPTIIRERISESKNRPSISENKNFIDEIEDIWNKRKDRYLKIADYQIETDHKSIDESVLEIISVINKAKTD